VILNIKGSAQEPFILFGFDISVCIGGRIGFVRFSGEPITKGFDAFAELAGDPADSAGSEKQKYYDQNDDPFRASW
jgi:hypothetical protein